MKELGRLRGDALPAGLWRHLRTPLFLPNGYVLFEHPDLPAGATSRVATIFKMFDGLSRKWSIA
jgi:hypothetical protein